MASSKYLMAFLASLPLSSSIHPLATNPYDKEKRILFFTNDWASYFAYK